MNAVTQRFGVDQVHAARVEKTALVLLKPVAGAWYFLDPRMRKMLSWAARLHEVGINIAHSQYHRHSAYILEYANLTGFSCQQHRVLGAIVGAQRQKYRRKSFKNLPEQGRGGAMQLAVLLRLSVTFNHGRSVAGLPAIGMKVRGNDIWLVLPQAWLEDHPLTAADLETERQYLAKAGYTLMISTRKGT